MKTEERNNTQDLETAVNPAKSPSAFLVTSAILGVVTILVLAVSYYNGLIGS